MRVDRCRGGCKAERRTTFRFATVELVVAVDDFVTPPSSSFHHRILTDPIDVYSEDVVVVIVFVAGANGPSCAGYKLLPPPTSRQLRLDPQLGADHPKASTTSSRVIAPDLLRGLILPLMSLDHAALFMGAWLHGTPKQTESAGTVFTRWNFNAAYISRTITTCAHPASSS